MNFFLKLSLSLLIFSCGISALLYAFDWKVQNFSAPYLHHDATLLPEKKVALLLGTTPKLADGQTNLYFLYRIQAAAALYQQGRIRHIIASGDHSRKNYNEPDAMRVALMELGVPREAITVDYAGLRTLDSVIRARDIFEQNSYIIVSQAFHNERAVYLARANGIEAYAYNARDVDYVWGFKTRIREVGARAKMFWDLLVDTPPKYGGEKIRLPD